LRIFSVKWESKRCNKSSCQQAAPAKTYAKDLAELCLTEPILSDKCANQRSQSTVYLSELYSGKVAAKLPQAKQAASLTGQLSSLKQSTRASNNY
jgi:hypothetical protein